MFTALRIARAAMALAAGLMIAVAAASAEDTRRTALVGVTPEGMTCLIGGSMRGIIADAEAVASRLQHKDPYTLIRMDETRGEVVSVGKPEPMDDGGDCESSYVQDLTFTDDQLGLFQVALSGKPDEVRAKLPKNFLRLPVKDDDHMKIVAEVLTEAGLVNPKIDIKQLLAADLDGDGRQETIINAIHTKRDNETRGEYSLLLLRRETAGKQEVIEIKKQISLEDKDEPSLLVEHTVVSLMDMDNDGAAELVLYGAFAFGEGWEVVKIKGKTAEQALFCGCG
ncbi:MAG: hypothetical protein AAF441_00315 [Pseudomonadota bacterium]